MKIKMFILAALALLVVLLILAAGCSYFNNVRSLYRDEDAGQTDSAGDYNNDFTLKDLDGNEVSLSNFSGDIVVLNFWATWCPPCRAEIPDFIEVNNDYTDRGVQFLGVSNEDIDTIKDFVEKNGINYPILVDRSNTYVQWDVRAIPTTFILDSDGTILFNKVGMLTKSELEAAIEDAL